MSKEIANTSNDEQEQLIQLVKKTLYPDGSDEGVRLAIEYCKAMNLDIMLKPLYLISYGGKEQIVPSITLSRVRAHRSGQYMGMSEPEFGPSITKNVGKTLMTYPEYCVIKVKRLVQGHVAEFPAKEYFLENVGTLADKVSPTMFWWKRPYGQLAKVAESQALKKAFPEIVPGTPTMEELHGDIKDDVLIEKELNSQEAVIDTANELKAKHQKKIEQEDEVADESTVEIANVHAGEVALLGKKTKLEILAILKDIVTSKNINLDVLNHYKAQANVKSFTEMTKAQLVDLVVIFNHLND